MDHCESCGMEIEAQAGKRYCQYCVNDKGELRDFADMLTRMSAFLRERDQSLSEADAERRALAFVADKPAWKDHPRVVEANAKRCESCGMPIESGVYCKHCSDSQGRLQSFDERFSRMVAFMRGLDPKVDQAEAEQRTLSYMATMPAWKNHPKVSAAVTQAAARR